MGSSWKRTKWLFKNLTPTQFMKYLFIKKPVVNDSEIEVDNTVPYEVDKDIKIAKEGTILVKPSGIGRLAFIVKLIRKEGMQIVKCVEITDYKKYSRTVFYKVSVEEQNVWFHILSKFYPESRNKAYLLYLDTPIDMVAKKKTLIRKKTGIDFFRVVDEDGIHTTSITPIHSSSRKERTYEESAIVHMIRDGLASLQDIDRLLEKE